jgi:hypothetical protein
LEAGAGAGLDKVEMEDESVVEGVQEGLQSGFYSCGRFSPTRETGVHHFHRLLAHYLKFLTGSRWILLQNITWRLCNVILITFGEIFKL